MLRFTSTSYANCETTVARCDAVLSPPAPEQPKKPAPVWHETLTLHVLNTVLSGWFERLFERVKLQVFFQGHVHRSVCTVM